MEYKSAIPCSGEWVAVYAKEDPDAWTFDIEPVMFWAMVEDEKGVAQFVGMIGVEHAIGSAAAPTLLGYARQDEDYSVKFRPSLEGWKARHAAAGVGGEDEKERMEQEIRALAAAKAPPELQLCHCNFVKTGCWPCEEGAHHDCPSACVVPLPSDSDDGSESN